MSLVPSMYCVSVGYGIVISAFTDWYLVFSATTPLEQIIMVLKNKEKLTVEHLELLITPRLAVFDLEWIWNYEDIPRLLHLTSIRSPVIHRNDRIVTYI